MKIVLKLDQQTISIISNAIHELVNRQLDVGNKSALMILSIAQEISEKIDVKALKWINRVDQENSKTKLSLRVHQAVALEIILNFAIVSAENHYSKLIMQAVIDELNQKLTL
jgi:hypothetical protein